MKTTVPLEGAVELRASLERMGVDWARREGAKAVAKAARVVREEAKTQARARGLHRTGALIANIVMKRERKVAGDEISYHVGVRHGREAYKAKTAIKQITRAPNGKIRVKYINDPFYWWWYEFGFKTRAIAARPFLRPAFEATKTRTYGEMLDAMKRAIAALDKTAKTRKKGY